MAKLVHPNTVAVHDVGTLGSRVFLAMERIRGATLSDWLAERRRPWREILKTFLAAGRGLSAAHAAGLIHRDFKPENVLVDEAGHVRVTDFGLARAMEGAAESHGAAGLDAVVATGTAITPARQPLTELGDIVGTPACMSPEQLRGAPADAKSDQFSFCVALWEALYGKRPFAGGTLLELAEHIQRQQLPRAPSHAAQDRLAHLIARGLSHDPAARFDSLDALLTALAHAARPRRIRRIVTGAVTLAVAGVVAAVVATITLERRTRPCEGIAHAAQRFPPAERETIHRAFASLHLPYAEATFQRVAERVADATARLDHTRVQLCEMTLIRHEQTPELFDRESACLDDLERELQAMLDAFRDPDREVVNRALNAVAGLSPAEECTDRAALLRELPPPSDPALNPRIDEARTLLARATAYNLLNRFEPVAPLIAQALSRLDGIDAPGLRGALYYQLGFALHWQGKPLEAEKALLKASTDAELAMADRPKAVALAELAQVEGRELSRLSEADALEKLAFAAMHRSGGSPMLEAALDSDLATLASIRGDFAGAVELDRKAVAQFQKNPQFRPSYAGALTNLSTDLQQAGRLPEAEATIRLALAQIEQEQGPLSPPFAVALQSLAQCLELQGKLEDALSTARRAEQVAAQAMPPKSGILADAFHLEANVLVDLKRPKEALPLFARALAIRDAPATQGNALAILLSETALAYRAAGEWKRALAADQRALTLRSQVLGPKSPQLAYQLLGLAEDAMGLHLYRQAQQRFGQVLERVAHAEIPGDVAAEARFGRARARAALGARKGLRQELQRVIAGYRAVPGDTSSEQREVRAWARAHGIALR